MVAAPLLTLGLLPLLAMQSPWWENYDIRERFVCADRLAVVLERNASQASLIAGNSRATLFREASDAAGLRYQNESLRLILRGDELTLEQLPSRRVCVRTEEV
jgi:hypothetical protein